MPVELTLGAANLGLAYGTAIRRDLPTDDEAEAILLHARLCGFRAVDTARAYGLSESRIGRHLERGEGFHCHQVCTKMAPLPALGTGSSPALGRRLAGESLAESRAALKAQGLRRVLLHRASHLADAGGAVWQRLREDRAAGHIAEIGVSVQTLDEAELALSRPDVDAIQLPCNIIDWRFDGSRFVQMLRAREAPVRIEARSIFLQGVLPSGTAANFPEVAQSYDRAGIADWLRTAANEFTGGALDALCLRYVGSLGWVDSIVVGADSIAQIDRLAAIAEMEPLPADAVTAIRAARPIVPEALLNPALWFPHGA